MYKLAIGITFGVLLFSNTAMALCTSYPWPLTNGSTADGSQVIANFNCAALTSGATMNSTSFTGNNAITSSSVSVSPLVINNHSSAVGIEFREDASAFMKQYFYEHTGTTANIFLAGEGSSYFLNSVGIGTASPTSKLHVVGGSGNVGQIIGTDNNAYSPSAYAGIATFWLSNASTTAGTGSGIGFAVKGAGPGAVASIAGISTAADYSTALVFQTRSSAGPDGEKMRITSAGNVGIGTTSPSYTLHVNGSVAGTSAYNNLSDTRLKKNIVPFVGGLALISQLQPVRFDWRAEGEREVGREFNLPAGKQIGFIAQDVGKVLPEAVSTAKGKDAIMSVAESKVVPVLVAAVKELKATNDNQAAEIGRLEGQVAALQHKMDKQTAQR